MAQDSDPNIDAIMPDLERISAEILALRIPMNERMGIAVIAASHFVGTASGLLEKISRAKKGPELDAAGWAEAVMQFVVARAKSERH